MNFELVIWFDNRSGVTHVCKRLISEGYSEHITPISAADDEKNVIKEMCRQTAADYGAPNVNNIKTELLKLLTDFKRCKDTSENDIEVTAYSKLIAGIEYILEAKKL